MGHVPPGPLRVVGAGGHVQRCQYRGAPGEGDLLSLGAPRDPRRSLGDGGETRVADWYRARGYRILARNWRSRQGEIDLVAAGAGVIVFCEVKTRSSAAFGQPYEAVTPTKQMRIRRLAAEWLRVAGPSERTGPAPDIRFDVASVRGRAVEVIEGAF